MNSFTVDGIDYCIVRNPYTNGPMIARIDGALVGNRKEICRRFLRQHGWTDEKMRTKITNDLERRENEHRSEGMQFTRIVKIGSITTRDAAEDWEAERIATYKQSHNGQRPKYNQNDSGK